MPFLLCSGIDFNRGVTYGVARESTLVRLEANIAISEILYFKKWWFDTIGALGLCNLTVIRPFYQFQVVSGIEYLHRSPHAQTKYGSHYGIKYVCINSYVTVEYRRTLHLMVDRVSQYHGMSTLKLSMARSACKCYSVV